MYPEKQQQQLFSQLRHLIRQMDVENYDRPIALLSGASIGGHIRHIAELYIELFRGYASGIVNYDRRERDTRVEKDPLFALQLLDQIEKEIERPDKELLLIMDATEEEAANTATKTNYHRELIFTIDHTVHHMALIRAGLNELGNFTVENEFGVARSTIKYRKSICAQ